MPKIYNVKPVLLILTKPEDPNFTPIYVGTFTSAQAAGNWRRKYAARTDATCCHLIDVRDPDDIANELTDGEDGSILW